MMRMLEAWAEHMISVSIQAALLIALALAVSVALRRASPQMRYALWAVVLLRLCVPVNIATPIGAEDWVRGAVAGLFEEEVQSLSMPVVPMTAAPVMLDVQVDYAPTPPPPEPRFSWHSDWRWAVALAWFGGVLVLSVLVAARAYALKRQLKRCRTSKKEEFARYVKNVARRCGVRGRVRVLISSDATKLPAPAVFGLLRPALLLPRSLERNWPKEDIEPALLHEFAHLRRRDLLVNAVQIAVQVFYFFHPLVWIANALMRRERELAADDEAVRGCCGDAVRYSRSVLSAVGSRRANLFSAALGLAMAENASLLSKRVRRILRPGYRCGRANRTMFAAVLLLACACIAISGSRTPATAQEQAASESAQPDNPILDTKLTIRLDGPTTLDDFVRRITDASLIQPRFFIAPGIDLKVYANYIDRPLREILDSLLLPRGLTWSMSGDGLISIQYELESRTFDLTKDQTEKIQHLLDNKTLQNIVWGQQTPPFEGAKLDLNAPGETLSVIGARVHIEKVADLLSSIATPDKGWETRIYEILPEDATRFNEAVKRLGLNSPDDTQSEAQIEIEGSELIVRTTPENIDKIEELLIGEKFIEPLRDEGLEIANFNLSPTDPELENTNLTRRILDAVKVLLYSASGVEAAEAAGRRLLFDEQTKQLTILDTPTNIRRIRNYLKTIPELRSDRLAQEVYFPKFTTPEILMEKARVALAEKYPDSNVSINPYGSINAVIIRCELNRVKEVRDLVVALDAEFGAQGEPELQTRIFDIKPKDAEKNTEEINREFARRIHDAVLMLIFKKLPPANGRRRLHLEENTFQLFVTDTPENVKRVERYIASLPDLPPLEMRETVVLQHANAEDLAKQIQQILGGKNYSISISADPKSNSLTIIYTDPALWADASELVRQLDVPTWAVELYVLSPRGYAYLIPCIDGILARYQVDAHWLDFYGEITSEKSIIARIGIAQTVDDLAGGKGIVVPERRFEAGKEYVFDGWRFSMQLKPANQVGHFELGLFPPQSKLSIVHLKHAIASKLVERIKKIMVNIPENELTLKPGASMIVISYTNASLYEEVSRLITQLDRPTAQAEISTKFGDTNGPRVTFLDGVQGEFRVEGLPDGAQRSLQIQPFISNADEASLKLREFGPGEFDGPPVAETTLRLRVGESSEFNGMTITLEKIHMYDKSEVGAPR